MINLSRDLDPVHSGDKRLFGPLAKGVKGDIWTRYLHNLVVEAGVGERKARRVRR